MKLSQQQVRAIAQEVVNKVREARAKNVKLTKVHEKAIERILAVKKRINYLNEQTKELNAQVTDFSKEYLGSSYYYYDAGTPKELAERMLQAMANSNIPNLTNVENEIILQTVFTDKEEMSEMIDTLVKKFS